MHELQFVPAEGDVKEIMGYLGWMRGDGVEHEDEHLIEVTRK